MARLLPRAAAFFAHLQLAYVLIPWACTKQDAVLACTSSAVSPCCSALAGVAAAWLSRARTSEAGEHAPGHPVEGPGPLFRTRFMGDTGLGVGALLTLILFMQWVAGFFITVCQ